MLEVLKDNGGLDELKNWPLEVAASARRLLLEFHSVFSLEPNEMGCTDTTEHVIEVTNSEPFRERFRRIAPPMVDEVRQHIQEMLDGGAIHPSQSPWCNAVVLVRKKDGSLRFCIDFRKLNERTRKDAYPLPRMQEQMESMVGTRHFSCIDLKSGFWQVKMAEESRQYTAFTVGSMGVYEFLRMPFGLCNAPATFQHLMQECLGELNLTYTLIYLDDVIVFSSTPEEHLVRLRAVLERFLEHGLKLKPSKCHFFRTEIDYLGHKVSADGMTPGTDNVKGIAEMAPPTTVTEVRRFLGATGFYRRFIKGYAKIAKPLSDLLAGDNSKLKGERVDISPEALVAYEELKMRCMTSPVLAFANFEKPFLLETDASKEGLGAVLSQKQDDGRYHPVAFASRALHGGEKNYHSSKLEFLALKWAITEQFREYLQYGPFVVRTDNNPLTYVLTTPNLDAIGHRWVAALADFDMSIEYLKGTDNKVADTLSRVSVRLDKETVDEILERAKNCMAPRAKTDDPRLVQQAEIMEEDFVIQVRAIADKEPAMRKLEQADWPMLQRHDPVLRHVLDWMALPSHGRSSLGDHLKGKIPAGTEKPFQIRQKDFVLKQQMLYLKVT